MISKQLSVTKLLGWRVGQYDISSAISIIKSSSMIYSGYKLKLFMKWYIIYNNQHRKFPYKTIQLQDQIIANQITFQLVLQTAKRWWGNSLHHIHILETVVVFFGISTVQKSRAMEICCMPRSKNIILWKIFRAKRLWWCNDRLCLYKNIGLIYKGLVNYVLGG